MPETAEKPQNVFETSGRIGGSLDQEVSEETVEELMSGLVVACLDEWRAFKPSNRNKRLIIDLGVKIFDMLVKYKASQSELKELKRQLEALRELGVP